MVENWLLERIEEIIKRPIFEQTGQMAGGQWHYSPEIAIVITSDFFGQNRLNDTDILFLPCWVI